MRHGPIITEFAATFKIFLRSKGAMFWTIAFPVLLIVVFGAIFSNAGAATHTVYVLNLDGGAGSQQFLEEMNATHAIEVRMVDPKVDSSQFIRQNAVSAFLIIPSGFDEAIKDRNGTAMVTLLSDRSSSSAAVLGILGNVADTFDLQVSQGHRYVSVASSSVVDSHSSYMDFFLPGVIGLTIMSNSVYFIAGTWTEGKTSGIFKKLATTPMARAQWLAAKMMFEMVMVMISIGVIFVTGMLLYNVYMSLTLSALAMILMASGMFIGLGMVIVRFASTEQSSNAAISAITFPMMFLSGSFFPLEQMPSYLRSIASVMPLTYVNDGLRDAMVFSNDSAMLIDLAIVALLFLVLFVAGATLNTWKEDGEGTSLLGRLRKNPGRSPEVRS